jgi:hypothetical protein
MLINVKYSCKLCGIIKRNVIIPERLENQDIKDYLENVVMISLAEDHQHVSPNCRPTHFQDLMIPYTDKGAGYNQN